MTGRIADLYDVFVDWPSRLRREMPGLIDRLRSVDARRVLDVGCGTGHHVTALLEAGFDAFGSDLSPDMLAQAAGRCGEPDRFMQWKLGQKPPVSLADLAPFDAIISLGNVWPQLLDDRSVEATLAAFEQLLRPGGLVVIAFKALAVRRATGNPYMPLLKRDYQGRALFFVRFIDFDGSDQAADIQRDDTAAFHMIIASQSPDPHGSAVETHRVSPMRIWSPEQAGRRLAEAGFEAVELTGPLTEPPAPPTGEDVCLTAGKP